MKYSKYTFMTVMVSLMLLSGCSGKDTDTPTLADSTVQTQDVNDKGIPFNQASRNNGAWGAVYMTKEELNDPSVDIVSYNKVPPLAEDSDVQKWDKVFGPEPAFTAKDGETLYRESCAGCHMHQGEGALGAGYYPPLANNSKMESKYYIMDILINGFRGMPAFHDMMDNEQIAAVTQYVMEDLNGFEVTVTPGDVAQLRHDNPPGDDPHR